MLCYCQRIVRDHSAHWLDAYDTETLSGLVADFQPPAGMLTQLPDLAEPITAMIREIKTQLPSGLMESAQGAAREAAAAAQEHWELIAPILRQVEADGERMRAALQSFTGFQPTEFAAFARDLPAILAREQEAREAERPAELCYDKVIHTAHTAYFRSGAKLGRLLSRVLLAVRYLPASVVTLEYMLRQLVLIHAALCDILRIAPLVAILAGSALRLYRGNEPPAGEATLPHRGPPLTATPVAANAPNALS